MGYLAFRRCSTSCTGTPRAALEICAQSMGCDRCHSVAARAARWLLEMDDRGPQDEFTLTREFLALP